MPNQSLRERVEEIIYRWSNENPHTQQENKISALLQLFTAFAKEIEEAVPERKVDFDPNSLKEIMTTQSDIMYNVARSQVLHVIKSWVGE